MSGEQRVEASFPKMRIGSHGVSNAALLHDAEAQAIDKRVALIGLAAHHGFRGRDQVTVRIQQKEIRAAFHMVQVLGLEMRAVAHYQQRAGFTYHPLRGHRLRPTLIRRNSGNGGLVLRITAIEQGERVCMSQTRICGSGSCVRMRGPRWLSCADYPDTTTKCIA
jgi:hypothetical protein